MKKRLIYILPALLLFNACTKDISRFNEETKKTADVPPGSLFSNALKSLADVVASGSAFRVVVKHWAAAIYQDESQYNFTTAAFPDNWWNTMYRSVLNNLESSRLLIEESNIVDGVKQNQLAIIDIMEVYTLHILVTTFGDIPYTEALNGENLFPKYDDAKTVYTDLLKRLSEDIGKLNTASGSFSTTEDFMYKGSVAGWIKFANTLQLKMGLVIADNDNAAAKVAVESAAGKTIASATDNAVVKYLAVTPNTNPLYNTLILSGRSDWVSAQDIVNPMNTLSDPRLTLYFRPNNAGNYVGGVVGKQNTFEDVAKPSTIVSAPDAPVLLADYVETEFLLAEAKERGYNVSGTAEQHYNNAIKASVIYWSGTAVSADTYLAKPAVAYSTATGDWKQKIGTQKWIALYNRPFDAWLDLRRLDYPKLTLPVGALSGFPNRYMYPSNEQLLNGTNYTAASTAIGGDKVETKLFWDKF
ncbi:MAG TPA: SusD/RagB family nutrient-binding outer membrane lipoprotein [Flavitalea sp.]|nr:SusD/RagB family nutrient-binding outer membrane lipoprotein [Flavitalea sp.]